MEYQLPLARGNWGGLPTKPIRGGSTHSTGPISRGRWSSACALQKRFAAVRFCLASPDMPLRPRWRGKSLVRTRCRVQSPGAAPICPVSIAGDAAVLYTDDPFSVWTECWPLSTGWRRNFSAHYRANRAQNRQQRCCKTHWREQL